MTNIDMYYSGETYTNGYCKKYSFKPVSDNTYMFTIEDFGYGRVGGKEGQEKIDMSDLGMFDPSGGPYVCLGVMVDDKEIVRISSVEEGFLLEVQ